MRCLRPSLHLLFARIFRRDHRFRRVIRMRVSDKTAAPCPNNALCPRPATRNLAVKAKRPNTMVAGLLRGAALMSQHEMAGGRYE